MKFTTASEELATALTEAGTVIDPRSPAEMFRHARIRVVGLGLEVAGQGLGGSLATTIQCEPKTEGACLVDARELTTRLKAAGGQVELSLKDHKLTVKAIGKSLRYTMTVMGADDWPTLPEPKGDAVTLPAAVLMQCVTRCGFAVSQDEARAMAALFIRSGKDGLMAFATDGHRLAMVKLPQEGFCSLDIGTRGVERLKRLLGGSEGDVEISSTGSVSFVRFGTTVTSFGNKGYTMPPVEQVMPKTEDFKATLKLNRDELKSVVSAASLAGVERDKDGKIGGRRDVSLKVSFGGPTVRFESSSAEYGEAFSEIEAPCETELTLGVNARYLLEAIGACDEDLTLAFTDDLGPLCIESGSVKHVVMPTRV